MLAYADKVPTVDLLAVSMSLLERNNRLLANNIANIDTPNFRPSHIDFHESLKRALRGMAATPGGAVKTLRVVLEEDGSEARNDGNTVDIENEMMRLAANTSKYELYGSLLKKKFQITKNMLTRIR